MDKREQAAIAYTGVQGRMKNEPAAYKRMCFRDGWDAAIAAIEPAPASVPVGAVDALASYQQADAAGTMVLVSRQAIDECLPALRALAEKGEA